jgi:general secretion pathway protein H
MAPTPAPRRRVSRKVRRTRGFTLVEMMVVIVILGLIAGVAVLALPEPGGGVRAEAERFAARASAAREAALINARATAVSVDPASYAVSESGGGEWRELARYEWEAGTRPDLAGPARIVFDPTGVSDPLELTLRRAERTALVRISADGDISIPR